MLTISGKDRFCCRDQRDFSPTYEILVLPKNPQSGGSFLYILFGLKFVWLHQFRSVHVFFSKTLVMQALPVAITSLVPWCSDACVSEFLTRPPRLELQAWSVSGHQAWWEWVPVPLLRFTHSGNDSRRIFAHDDREGRSRND